MSKHKCVFLHHTDGDLCTVDVTVGPSVWIFVTDKYKFQGYYSMVMSGEINDSQQYHYQLRGTHPTVVPAGWAANPLSDYMPGGDHMTLPPDTVVNRTAVQEPPCLCESRALTTVGHDANCRYLHWKRNLVK